MFLPLQLECTVFNILSIFLCGLNQGKSTKMESALWRRNLELWLHGEGLPAQSVFSKQKQTKRFGFLKSLSKFFVINTWYKWFWTQECALDVSVSTLRTQRKSLVKIWWRIQSERSIFRVSKSDFDFKYFWHIQSRILFLSWRKYNWKINWVFPSSNPAAKSILTWWL